MLKDCAFLDICFKTYYNMTCYESDEELCEGCDLNAERGPLTCKPENIYMEGDRVHDVALMPGLWMLHVMGSNIRLDYDKVKLCLTRHLLCRTGCEETVSSIIHPFYANHMIIPGGEYEICIPPQQAPGYEPCTPYRDGCLTVVVEPVTQDQVQAMQYNANVVMLEEIEQRRQIHKMLKDVGPALDYVGEQLNFQSTKLCEILCGLDKISDQLSDQAKQLKSMECLEEKIHDQLINVQAELGTLRDIDSSVCALIEVSTNILDNTKDLKELQEIRADLEKLDSILEHLESSQCSFEVIDAIADSNDTIAKNLGKVVSLLKDDKS